MKYCSIFSVTSKSEMTPSRSGRTATILAGVRPTIRFASAPMARILRVVRSIATTEGSSMTIPFPLTITRVFAVPRSMPMSCEKSPNNADSGFRGNGVTLHLPVTRSLAIGVAGRKAVYRTLLGWQNARYARADGDRSGRLAAGEAGRALLAEGSDPLLGVLAAGQRHVQPPLVVAVPLELE